MRSMLLKSEHQHQVEAFMLRAKQEVPLSPTEPSKDVRGLRAALIFEEAMETIQDGLGVEVSFLLENGRLRYIDMENKFEFSADNKFNLIETIDGCCDLAVVTSGTLSACGIPDIPFQREVNQNNLEKFLPGHTIREDGKIVKPPGHRPPDIRGVIREVFPFATEKHCFAVHKESSE